MAIIGQYFYNWVFKEGFMSSLNASHEWVNAIVWDGYNAPFIVVLTAATCLLFQRIKWNSRSILSTIGKYSLPIYLMQTPIQRILELSLPLDSWKQVHHVYGIILPFLTLTLCFALARLMYTNKYTSYIVKI